MEAQNLEVYHPPSLRITNSITITLTEKNYILWKSQFEVFLNGQGLLGYVTASLLNQLLRSPSQESTVRLLKPQTLTLPSGFKRTKL